MRKTKVVRRRRIYLDVSEQRGFLEYIGGGVPYLWVGNNSRCYGTINDADTEALRDMCERILNYQKRKGFKGA